MKKNESNETKATKVKDKPLKSDNHILLAIAENQEWLINKAEKTGKVPRSVIEKISEARVEAIKTHIAEVTKGMNAQQS